MSRGLSRAEVQHTALEFVESLNFKVPLDFKVRDTWKELYGFDSVCGGAFHPAETAGERGFVTIAANNHRSKNVLIRTLRHEILGHFLLNTYSPEEKLYVIKRIVAAKNEPSMREAWRKVEHRYPDQSVSIQAEELFALIAEDVNVRLRSGIDVDPLLSSLKPVTPDAIIGTIKRRTNMLIGGELEQRTFPSTDIHEGFDVAWQNTVRQRYNRPGPESYPL